MTRAGYTKNGSPGGLNNRFFGSAAYAHSGARSQSINFQADEIKWSREPKRVHEFLFKYKMRGFGWPGTMNDGGDDDDADDEDSDNDNNRSFQALRAWGRQTPRWSRYLTKTDINMIPVIAGDAQFNIANFLDEN